jgi:hypothetical protein
LGLIFSLVSHFLFFFFLVFVKLIEFSLSYMHLGFPQFLEANLLPRWLEVLLTEKFFNACIFHEDAKKNEKNVYCLNCCISLCPHCLSPHRSHRLLQVSLSKFTKIIFQSSLLSPFSFLKLLIVRFLNCVLNFLIFVLLQIRRYVYHDVLRLDDAAKLIDCTSVQVSSSS